MSEREEKKIEMSQKQMEEAMMEMRKDMDMLMKEARVRAEQVMDRGRVAVRERPLTYVGLAFGVGLVVGAILLRSLEKD